MNPQRIWIGKGSIVWTTVKHLSHSCELSPDVSFVSLRVESIQHHRHDDPSQPKKSSNDVEGWIPQEFLLSKPMTTSGTIKIRWYCAKLFPINVKISRVEAFSLFGHQSWCVDQKDFPFEIRGHCVSSMEAHPRY